MAAAEIANHTAWITALLLGAQASLGLLRVRALPGAGNSVRSARTWVLAAHVVIGLAVPPLALAHGWFSMKVPGIRRTSAAGLWIATAALLLLGVQAVAGITMLRVGDPERITTRRVHLALAVVLIGLAATHVLLNG